jgi:predicted AlkP superfamily pyrophosphatase or phosphodiesterase
MGDELTLDFAKEVVKQEKIGQGDATDMLAISFSTNDYIAHAFGPNSLEAEEGVLRLDATLANLFQFVDQTVGLDKTLIVLSSDHGFDEVPEHQHQLGFDAGRHYPEKFLEQVNAGLQERYKSDESFVVAFWNPSLYLNHETLDKLALEPVEAERALAEEILQVPGIALAMTRSDLMAGTITDSPIMRKVQRAFHPELSGSVLIVQDQFWYPYPNAEEFAAMHGSPYAYDTYVPIMLAGPGIPPQMVSRLVAPEDIAITVASYMGTKPPSGSVGEVLFEALPAGPRSVQAASSH